MSKKSEYIILGLILIVAVFTRFYNLGGPSLFNDELATVHYASTETLAEMMTEHVITDVHPPGFQFMMFYWVHNIGDNEFWLRLPTAVVGVLAIFMIYLLGKYLYTPREGLIAAALTIVMWAPLYYSQEARAYSFIFLFSITGIFYWLKIVQAYLKDNRPKISWIIILSITGILSEYFQYLGLFLFILLGVFTVFLFYKDFKKLFLALIPFFIIAIAFLPWLPYALDQIAMGVGWIKPPKILAFGYFLAFLFNLSPYVLGTAVILVSILLIQLLKNRFPRENLFINTEMFLILWLTVPFAIIFIKSLVSKPVLTYYSMIISAAPAYLLLARSITTLKIKERFKHIVAVLVILFFGWQLVYDMDYYSQPYKDHFMVFGKRFNKRTKQMFREAADYVKVNDRKYANSVIAGYAWFPFYFDYYFDKLDFDRTVDIHVLDSKDTIKFNGDILSGKDYIWVVRGHKEVDSLYFDWMAKNFKLIHHEPLIGAEVHLYKIE